MAQVDRALDENIALSALDLSACGIGETEFLSLSRALVRCIEKDALPPGGVDNFSLQRLDLSVNDLDEDCANPLREVIASTHPISYLNLDFNALGLHGKILTKEKEEKKK